LELVDGADARTGQNLLDREHLSVVRRYDEDVFHGQQRALALAVGPRRAIRKDAVHKSGDRGGLFGRRILIAAMIDREIAEACTANSSGTFNYLAIEAAPRSRNISRSGSHAAGFAKLPSAAARSSTER
jgi:hypothetical protein